MRPPWGCRICHGDRTTLGTISTTKGMRFLRAPQSQRRKRNGAHSLREQSAPNTFPRTRIGRDPGITQTGRITRRGVIVIKTPSSNTGNLPTTRNRRRRDLTNTGNTRRTTTRTVITLHTVEEAEGEVEEGEKEWDSTRASVCN